MNLLIVEDDPIVLADLTKDIKQEFIDSTVVHAKDYETAKQILEHSIFDIAVLDIKLGGEKTGIDLANYINKVLDIDIVFVTAYSDEKICKNIGKVGASAFLLKPINKNQFLVTLNSIMSRKHAKENISSTKSMSGGIYRDNRIDYYRNSVDSYFMVSVTDIKGDIIFANQTFLDETFYKKEEVLGQNLRILNSGHHPKSVFKDLWSTVLRGGVWQGELKNKRKDHSFYWSFMTIIPLLDGKGRPISFFSIGQNINHLIEEMELSQEQKSQSDRNLKAVQKRLTHLSKINRLNSLSTSIAHDVKGPLASLGLMVTVLKEREEVKNNEDLADLFDSIETNIDGISRVVRNIYRMYRIENSQLVIDIDVLKIINELLEIIASEVNSEKTKIIFTNDTGLNEAFVSFSQETLETAILNIVHNALKAIKKAKKVKGILSIDLSKSETNLNISISDNGCGISQEELEDIFCPFYTIDTEDSDEGSGFGLSLSKDAIENSGGKLSVESTLGEGASFTISIPISPLNSKKE